MTNRRLKELIQEFLGILPDEDKEEWYNTTKGVAEDIMESFQYFLDSKRKRRSQE